MTKLDTVIAVKDIEKSAKWYEQVFGFQGKGEHLSVLYSENNEIVLCLHSWEMDHHPTMVNQNITPGNGIIHYPKDGFADKILEVAEEVCQTASTCEGLIEAGAWQEKEKNRIIMLSLWENTEVAIEASQKLRPIIAEAPFSKWERKPSDNMLELEKMV